MFGFAMWAFSFCCFFILDKIYCELIEDNNSFGFIFFLALLIGIFSEFGLRAVVK
jgi:hypothetical protein